MRKPLATALALLPLTTPTYAATDWYVLKYGSGLCERSSVLAIQHHFPPGAAPGTYETSLRELGRFKGKQIFREDNGKIRGVLVTSIDDIAMSFFLQPRSVTRSRKGL
jgi:hypothetical protein